MSQSRKRSSIWMHFNKNIKSNDKAECNICKAKISIRAGSTNNLHRHLKTQHPTVQVAELRQQDSNNNDDDQGNDGASTSAEPTTTSSQSSTSTLLPGQTPTSSHRTTGTIPKTKQTYLHNYVAPVITPMRQGKIDEELAKMIATDFQPFKIVEDKGFKRYSNALNPSYTLPSRKTISQTVANMYQKEAASLKERVSKLSAVCLTIDCWTSRATTSFMAVTCHFIEDFKMSSCLLDCFEISDRHTAENLAKNILNVAKDWKVEDKVVCCVTDNAANITKAIQITKWTHLPCLAHTINLIARDSLKGLKPILDKVKEAVEYFHRSTLGAEKLKATQIQMGMAELRPKQDCITRWNSTYDMLNSFLKSKDAIISTLAITNASVSPLSQEEWSILQEVCTILEPFQEVTVEISAERYVIS